MHTSLAACVAGAILAVLVVTPETPASAAPTAPQVRELFCRGGGAAHTYYSVQYDNTTNPPTMRRISLMMDFQKYTSPAGSAGQNLPPGYCGYATVGMQAYEPSTLGASRLLGNVSMMFFNDPSRGQSGVSGVTSDFQHVLESSAVKKYKIHWFPAGGTWSWIDLDALN